MIKHNKNDDENERQVHRYDINRPTITHKIFETNSSFHVK